MSFQDASQCCQRDLMDITENGIVNNDVGFGSSLSLVALLAKAIFMIFIGVNMGPFLNVVLDPM